MKKFAGERGAATLIENAIVVPVVLGIVFMLVFVGFSLHQKAVMESAIERSAIIVAKTVADPNYFNITFANSTRDVNDISRVQIKGTGYVNAPYRYLFAGRSLIPDSEKALIKLIKKNQIFLDTDPTVSVERQSGIFPKIIVTASQDYEVPDIIPGITLPPIVSINTESVVAVGQPAELIRNADYAIDIISGVLNSDVMQTVKDTISKISFFRKKVE